MSPEQHEREEPREVWPIGRRILERIRAEVNGEGAYFQGEEGEDVFRSLYLTDRDVCIPDHLIGEDVLTDIRSLYYWTLDGVHEELQERLNPNAFLQVFVDPSYDDARYALLVADDRLLLQVGKKAWNFYWESEEAMAEELEIWYQQAAAGLMPAAQPAELPPEPSAGETSPGSNHFVVTLRTERKLVVTAPTKHQAVDLALAWGNNEDSENVQLSYEELIGGIVEAVEENEDDSASSEPEGGGG